MAADSPIRISASLLSADFANLGRDVTAAERAGCDEIHFDVMDGHFVPNLTFGAPVLQAVRGVTGLPIAAHLMVEAPDRYIEAFAAAGATSFIVHVEICPHLHRTIEAIKSAGMQAGVAVNPSTSIAAIDEALDYTDAVLLMTVNPGFGGQKFITGVLPKMSRLARVVRERGLNVDIGVDGGIKADTARAAVEAGARTLVSGSGIFGHGRGIEAAVRELRLAATGSRPPAG
jgi:ribulose-phosphate 3-epimerase